MNLVIGIAAGLIWGALAAIVNLQINKKALAKGSTNSLLAANLARTFVDLAALAAVFLLRRFLPFSYEGMLLGTAISLSLISVVFAFRLAGKQKKGGKQG
jgi:MFS superfamily sulfate permease-like transporter